MKKFGTLLIGVMTLILFSCKKDEPQPKDTGSLKVDIGLSILVDEVNNGLKSTMGIEDFKVTIFNSDDSEVMTFETASEMPDVIELEQGDYYVEAHSDNNLPAVFENPYYYGISEVFTIIKNEEQSVTVTCGLANTIVSVVYSTDIVSSFNDYSTTVSTALGSLVYSKNEIRLGYFQTLPFTILVELTYLNQEGAETTKTLSGSIPEPLANRHYQININASTNVGGSGIVLVLDETEIPLELVDISEGSDIPSDGIIKYGDLLITEIMYDPVALSDAEGEWIEIYNNTDNMINLQNLVLEREGSGQFTITESIELPGRQYFLFAKNEIAAAVSNKVIYGSAILLPNTGAILAISNATIEEVPGALIFSVNYGESGFPALPGASISLNPNKFNAGDGILGTSWCTSVSAYNTGDLGTPGTANDACQ